MKFEVVFRTVPNGQYISRCVEADSWNDAAVQSINELVALGHLSADAPAPLPETIRRIVR